MTLAERIRRMFAPKRQTQWRRFEAAQLDRLTSNWISTEASLNEELRTDLNKLRARGRQLVNNNDYARKFRGMVENNIIGPNGIKLQARVENAPGKPDTLANFAIEAAWDRWKAVADVTGKFHFDDLCENLVGGLPADGEFLVNIVHSADNPFKFALQVIDVDRIDTMYNVAGTSTTNAVIMGVEVNTYRRPVAMHLFAGHPSDGQNTNRERVRVPIDNLIHGYRVERAEQVRGIPWMAPGMLSLHHLGSFKLAALLAAEHGANHYGFFTSPDGTTPIADDEENGQQITVSQPGVFDTLPSGTTFAPFESKYPNEVFSPFVKTTLQRIATGWRVAYVSLANDLEGVNYSSIRAGVLEERDRWRSDQRWFINTLLERIYPLWLKSALLAGQITMPNGSSLPASKIDKFTAHEWQPRSWEWVDPLKDMEAKVLAIRAGLASPQQVASQMGGDYLDNIDQIKAAMDYAGTAGVALPALEDAPKNTIATE